MALGRDELRPLNNDHLVSCRGHLAGEIGLVKAHIVEIIWRFQHGPVGKTPQPGRRPGRQPPVRIVDGRSFVFWPPRHAYDDLRFLTEETLRRAMDELVRPDKDGLLLKAHLLGTGKDAGCWYSVNVEAVHARDPLYAPTPLLHPRNPQNGGIRTPKMGGSPPPERGYSGPQNGGAYKEEDSSLEKTTTEDPEGAAQSPEVAAAVLLLVEEGFDRADADRQVAKYGPERAREAVLALRDSRKAGTEHPNPTGWIYKCMVEGWKPKPATRPAVDRGPNVLPETDEQRRSREELRAVDALSEDARSAMLPAIRQMWYARRRECPFPPMPWRSSMVRRFACEIMRDRSSASGDQEGGGELSASPVAAKPNGGERAHG